ncbi:MAG: hypothetical protein KF777_10475 [Planctomycetaceae bacterium]|nr:hypothetical protein [Planctomycetaceae bacterium]
MAVLQRFAVDAGRFCLNAWVGAAVLFVIVGVTEVTSSQVDSTMRDVLVTLRFPWYYRSGFTLLGCSLVALLLGGANWGWRRWPLLVLVAVSLGLMVADYYTIFVPLVELVTPPGKPRTPAFAAYHEASTAINTAGLALILLACFVCAGRFPQPEVARLETSNT